MKRSDLWFVFILVALPLVLAGPACQGPAKRQLASNKPAVTLPTPQPAARPAAATSATIRLQKAISQARVQRKAIYLEFHSNLCVKCWFYAATVLSSQEGQQALQDVVFLQFTIEEAPAYARRFKVATLPYGLLLQPGRSGTDIKILNRHDGALSLDDLRTFLRQGDKIK